MLFVVLLAHCFSFVFCSTFCENAPLGPSLVKSGVCLKVWAPGASNGYAIFDPSDFVPLKKDENGVFTGFASYAKPGYSYVYMFDTNVMRLDPYAQIMSKNRSVVHDPAFNFTAPPPPPSFDVAEALIYELHVPSFTEEGTFASASTKLAYLKDLGVTHIELMPVAAFGGSAEGWGYDPVSPMATMEAFGGYLGLKNFVNAARKLEMFVMLDVVFNHMDPDNILLDFDGSSPKDLGIYFYSGNNSETEWGPR